MEEREREIDSLVRPEAGTTQEVHRVEKNGVFLLTYLYGRGTLF